ncbi:MAG TPA: S41 family peptidase [Phycisphaerales bacterium]|nr:S41 family peptidase [Phycisphaerales bacterium]HMP36666.1 S41 family peptidase [Phycisphaerales bacterium]
MPSRRTLFLLTLLTVWAATVALLSATLISTAARVEWFAPAIVAREILERDLVEPPSDDAMRRAILEAIATASADPHTVWIPPERAAAFEKAVNATYAGIGAEIDARDGWLLVVTPLEDSPAAEAGVRAGDLILAIDGVSTRDRLPAECAPLLLGEPGTTVTIDLRSPEGEERRLEIVRRRIAASSVRGLERRGATAGEGWRWGLDPQRRIAYVRLSQFTERSAVDLRAALAAAAAELGGELEGLILDLRFNGGGSLGSAVAVADRFLAAGRIVEVRPRGGASFVADADDELGYAGPMIVLVNGASASASEVVAGALRDHGRAVILGTRTFGKGSVQELRPLPQEFGLLKLTTARWETPSGRVIERLPEATTWGVDPDEGFHVPMSDAEYAARAEALRRWEVPAAGRRGSGADLRRREGPDAAEGSRSADRPARGEAGLPAPASETPAGRDAAEEDRARWDDPAWIESALSDRQLAAALTALRHRIDHGAFVAVGEGAGDDASRRDELERARSRRARLMEQLAEIDRMLSSMEAAEAPSSAAP